MIHGKDYNRWVSEQISTLKLWANGAHSGSDMIRSSLYTNALHGSGIDFATTRKPMVTQWQGLDLEETYNRNLEDPAARALLSRWGWIDTPINYEINSWGFRSSGCREFDSIDEPSILTVGCSFTFGTGLPEKDVWAKLLADRLGLALINLATPGQGFSLTTRWLLDQGHTLKQPKMLAIFVPPPGRITWLVPGFGYIMGNTYSMKEFDRYPEIVNNRSVNAFAHYYADIQTINLWAEHRGIPVYFCDGAEFDPDTFESGLARDLKHLGVPWQIKIAEKFERMILTKPD